MQDIVNRYPYNAYTSPSQHENKFINKKLGTIIGEKNTDAGLQYGYPYAYKKTPVTKEYPIDGKNGPTSARRKYKDTYRINYIAIDSRDRNLLPQIVPSGITTLGNNPITFTAQSNIITINQQNHGLSVDDFVALNNISANQFTLNNPFNTSNGFSFIRITFPNPGHGLSPAYASAQNIFINISNVTSDLNVYSLNQLNGTHKVFLTANFDVSSVTPDARYLYIQLPLSATSTTNDTLDPATNALLPSSEWRNQGVVVNYLFVNGVPLFYLNNGTPVDIDHVLPYQSVTQIIDANNYTIRVDQNALASGNSGGNCITVTTILAVSNGYASANNYMYTLKKTYKNVVRIRLVSSEFPNTQYVIQSGVNDSLYWQDLQDQTNTTYSITVPAGSYPASDLQQEIQTLMNNVPLASTSPPQDHIFTVSINPDNNIVSFSSFIQHTLLNAMFIKYTIQEAGTSQVLQGAILYIIDPNNILKVGDHINIISAPNYDIVPSSAIIGQKTIIEVNNYTDSDNTIHHTVNGVTDPAPYGSTIYTVTICMQLMGYTAPLPSFYAVQLPPFTPLPVPGILRLGFHLF